MPATTSLTLLNEIRLTGSQDAWARFVDIYGPLLLKWNREAGLQDADAQDVAQNCLAFLCDRINGFSRKKLGSFRRWLRLIAFNKIREHRGRNNRAGSLDDLDDAAFAVPGDDFLYAENYYQDVLERAFRHLHRQFHKDSWNAFLSTAFQGQSVEEVAKELGMTPNAVYVARHRITHKISQVVREFIQDDDVPELKVGMVDHLTRQALETMREKLKNDK